MDTPAARAISRMVTALLIVDNPRLSRPVELVSPQLQGYVVFLHTPSHADWADGPIRMGGSAGRAVVAENYMALPQLYPA